MNEPSTTPSESTCRSQKVLSISIAAYNVEDYLGQALESCLIEDKNLLDVIVVDDGSTDGTALVAQKYVDEYPQVFRLVSKPNGGYGTTVNTGLAHAQGKYFRLLDGDDWFYARGLQRLVNDLVACDCDMAITPFVEVKGDEQQIVDQAHEDKSGLMPFTNDIVIKELSMHSITFKTEILRKSGLALPERRLYTDTLYAVTPLPLVSTVYVSHAPVYMYRLGREGQSVSLEGEVRNRHNKIQLIKDLVALYDSMEKGSAAQQVTGYWLSANASYLLWLLYRIAPSNDEAEARLLLDAIGTSPEAWQACRSQSKWFRLLTTPLGSKFTFAHWLTNHKAW